MESRHFYLKLIFLFAAALALSLCMFWWSSFLVSLSQSPPLSPDGQVACTLDAKICPDGSAVGRVGPKCEFAPCPNAVKASFDTPLVFTVGLSKTFTDGLTLTLRELNDSRCKPGMVCVWAGEITAVFHATGGSMGKSLKEVRLGMLTQKETVENGYTFRLQEAAEDGVTISVAKAPDEPAGSACYIGGCSSELCSEEKDTVSICLFKPEYECYKEATCERQASGQCGWTQTAELARCISQYQ